MNSIKHHLILFILLTICLFHSCTKNSVVDTNLQDPIDELDYRSSEVENSEVLVTVLGSIRTNPFALANINLALRTIYGQSTPLKSATHKYVKFSPSTHDHIAYLEDWETTQQVALFDFPFEYEIVTMGERYIDPSVADSLYTFLYASVPSGRSLPQVPYSALENLYLDKSNPFLIAESFWSTGNKGDINDYVFNGGLSYTEISQLGPPIISSIPIPAYPSEECPPGFQWRLVVDDSQVTPRPVYIWVCVPLPDYEEPTNDCGCSIPSSVNHPAGCIRVADDFTDVGIQLVTVKIKDKWFSSDVTLTDIDGCWDIDDYYTSSVWMWVKFKNDNVKARDGRQWLGLKAVEDYVNKFTDAPYNNISLLYVNGEEDNTSRPRMYWSAGHTLNTVNRYRILAAADGIPLPRTGLNWTNRQGDGAASAAMLQGNVFNSWPAFFAAIVMPITYAASTLVLPDITNRYEIDEPAGEFTGDAFHELGHASHYSLVGESYWYKYRNHIINNDGYGEFGDFANNSHTGIVALGEAIGNFTGSRYGFTPEGGEIGEWDADLNPDNFIPQGLIHDLIDDTPLDDVTDPNNVLITGPDNVRGFTPDMIFNGLTPNIESIRAFRDRLRTLHLQETPNTQADYNTFVDIYDVFN